MTIRILTWNILSGGFTKYGSDETRPPRLPALADVIRRLEPDVACLIDTYRWADMFSPNDLQQLFNFPFAYTAKLDDERLKILGHDNGITVLSHIPSTSAHTIRIATRNALAVRTPGLDIFPTYLDDTSEDTRKAQLTVLLREVHKNIPTVITGDFNTFDKSDLAKTSEALEKMRQAYPTAQAKMEHSLNEMKRGEVTRMLTNAGFIDQGKGRGNTMPAGLFPLKLATPIARIDYTFGNKSVKLKNFQVLTGEPYANLSDHYPILTTIAV